MALSKEPVITDIVNIVDRSITVNTKNVKELLANTNENSPIIIISAVGSRNVGKSTLLNFVLAFLKCGCNHAWAISGEKKWQGFGFGKKEQTTGVGTLNASLVPIHFEGRSLSLLLLDININEENENFSTLNSKLQLICTALSSTLLFVKQYFNEDNEAEKRMAQLMNQYTQYCDEDSLQKSSFYKVLINAPDHVSAYLKAEDTSCVNQNSRSSRERIFGENFTVSLPKYCESLPEDFQGELKYLKKAYKDHLKCFLMSSFSITKLLNNMTTGKCFKTTKHFLQQLKSVVKIVDDLDSRALQCSKVQDKIGLFKKRSSDPFLSDHHLQSKEPSHSLNTEGSSPDDGNTNNVIIDMDFLEPSMKDLQDSVLSLEKEQCKQESLKEVIERYRKLLNLCKSRRPFLENKTDACEKTLKVYNDKILTINTEKNHLYKLWKLQSEVQKRFTEQLYFTSEDFKIWSENAKVMTKNRNVDDNSEIPIWYETYMNIILIEAESINNNIRETERRAVDDAISIGLAFYEEKVKRYVGLLMFKEKELEIVDEKTLDIVLQSLKYGTDLENQKNFALNDFDAIQHVKQKTRCILEKLKTDFIQKNYSNLLEVANKLSKKAFKVYRTQLKTCIQDMKDLKVTQLYEFHNNAKEKTLNTFYKELPPLPMEIVEQFAKKLSEDMDLKHKKVREENVNDTKSMVAELSILGIQFGLAEIRFGIYRNGNPQLYKCNNIIGIPHYINLSEKISVGVKTETCGFKMEEILLDKVGKTHNTNIMGTSRPIQQEVIVALVFGCIKSAAERYFNEQIYKCVISVPNIFDHVHRQMIKDSASLAGFEVMAILSENAAAAVTFRFAPQFKSQFNATRNFSFDLSVHSYISETENDSSTIFKVTDREVVMLSSCNPAFVNELKDGGIVASLKSMVGKSPSELEIILNDAIGNSGVESQLMMLIRSGQSTTNFIPDEKKVKKFCKKISHECFSNSIVFGTIYYAEELRLGGDFSVKEALQYGVVIECLDNKPVSISRNTHLPTSVDVPFDLADNLHKNFYLNKLQGRTLPLGTYSVLTHYKSEGHNRGQLQFSFDKSGFLTTKAFIISGNIKVEVYVNEQTNNSTEQRKREMAVSIKEIHNLQKEAEAQVKLNADLQKEFERISNLVERRKTLSKSFKRALQNTLAMCEQVLKDKYSNCDLLKQQLESLKKAEETFLL